MQEPTIRAFFDARTHTLTYVVFDPETRDALVIDPVLDYEPASSKLWTESVDELVAFITQQGLRLHLILETHAHADHLSGAQILKDAFPEARLAIGERITQVQSIFKDIFELPDDFHADGQQFDRLLSPSEHIEVGSLGVDVIPTPGHTPACVTYKIGDAIFTGDALFMPDMGTGRCDFPGGSARDLYESIMRLYALPEHTCVHVGHDYMPGGRELAYKASIGEHRARNVALPADRECEDFVAWRQARDAKLDAPKLLFQSVQVNIDAGALPKSPFFKIPINIFRPSQSEPENLSIEQLKPS